MTQPKPQDAGKFTQHGLLKGGALGGDVYFLGEDGQIYQCAIDTTGEKPANYKGVHIDVLPVEESKYPSYFSEPYGFKRQPDVSLEEQARELVHQQAIRDLERTLQSTFEHGGRNGVYQTQTGEVYFYDGEWGGDKRVYKLRYDAAADKGFKTPIGVADAPEQAIEPDARRTSFGSSAKQTPLHEEERDWTAYFKLVHQIKQEEQATKRDPYAPQPRGEETDFTRGEKKAMQVLRQGGEIQKQFAGNHVLQNKHGTAVYFRDGEKIKSLTFIFRKDATNVEQHDGLGVVEEVVPLSAYKKLLQEATPVEAVEGTDKAAALTALQATAKKHYSGIVQGVIEKAHNLMITKDGKRLLYIAEDKEPHIAYVEGNKLHDEPYSRSLTKNEPDGYYQALCRDCTGEHWQTLVQPLEGYGGKGGKEGTHQLLDARRNIHELVAQHGAVISGDNNTIFFLDEAGQTQAAQGFNGLAVHTKPVSFPLLVAASDPAGEVKLSPLHPPLARPVTKEAAEARVFDFLKDRAITDIRKLMEQTGAFVQRPDGNAVYYISNDGELMQATLGDGGQITQAPYRDPMSRGTDRNPVADMRYFANGLSMLAKGDGHSSLAKVEDCPPLRDGQDPFEVATQILQRKSVSLGETKKQLITRLKANNNVLVKPGGGGYKPAVLTFDPATETFSNAYHSISERTRSDSYLPVRFIEDDTSDVVTSEGRMRTYLQHGQTLAELQMPEAIVALASKPETAQQGSMAILRELFARELTEKLKEAGGHGVLMTGTWSSSRSGQYFELHKDGRITVREAAGAQDIVLYDPQAASVDKRYFIDTRRPDSSLSFGNDSQLLAGNYAPVRDAGDLPPGERGAGRTGRYG